MATEEVKMEQATNQSLSVQGFLTELSDLDRELLGKRPGGWRPFKLKEWTADREKRIAEVVKKYAGNIDGNGNLPILVDANSSLPVRPETLEVASGQLIKATCVEKAAQKNRFKILFHRVHRVSVGGIYFVVRFVLKGENGVISFTNNYGIPYDNLSILIDVPISEPIFFVGEISYKSSSGYVGLKNAQFHVHTEDEINCL